MARPSNYLGANLTLQDTFSSLIERSNEVAYDLGTIIITTAPVTQANTTNGALTAGNAHVQGFFSANTLIASDQLRGGSIDTSGLLTISSNATFTADRIYTSDTTISDFGANVTLSSDTANNFTKHFTVDFGNTHFTQGELRVSGNTVFDGAAAIVEVFTQDVNVTANVDITNATVTVNSGTVTIGSDALDALNVNSDTTFNSDVLVGNDNTTTLEVNSNTAFNNDVYVGVDETDLLSINSNTVINNDMYVGSDGTDTLNVKSTSTFENDVTVGVDSTDTFNVNADADFNANVNVDGVLTTTNNVTLGSDGTDALTVNAISDFNANVNVDGVLTTTNNATLGSDGTDIVTVNATSDFNANVNVDGVLTTTNDATLGSSGTNSLAVNATSDFNANVNVDGVLTTTNNVTLGSDGTDALTVNATSDFNANVNVDGTFTSTNDATLGSDGTDTVTVNATSDFNANVNVDGILTTTNNVTLGSDGTDALTVNATSDFNANVNVDGTFTATSDATVGTDGTNISTFESRVVMNANTTIGNAEADVFTVVSTSTFQNGVTVGSDTTDQFTVNSNTDFVNDVTIGSDGTDTLIVNADSDFNANVNVDGAFTATDNVTLGTDATDQFTVNSNTGFVNDVTIGTDGTDTAIVNATADFNANVNVDGTFTATNDATIGTDGTDTLVVNATADYNANVNIDGELSVGNNVTLGASSTDTVTVPAEAVFNHNVTLGNSDADNVVINADINSNVVPTANSTHSLGRTDARWDNLFVDDITATANTTTQTAIIRNTTPTLVAKNSGVGYPALTVSLDANNGNSSNVVSFTTTSILPQTATISLGSLTSKFEKAYFASNTFITSTETRIDSATLTVSGTQVNVSSNTDVSGKFTVTGDTDLATTLISDLTVSANADILASVNVTQELIVTGETTLNANATITGTLAPSVDSTYDLGSSANRFATVYADNFVSEGFNLKALSDVPNSANANDILVANTTGGFDFIQRVDEFTDLLDTPATIVNDNVLVGNTSGGLEFRAYINSLVDLVDVVETNPANAEVLAYIADSGGFEFVSPLFLSEGFALNLDDIVDVDTQGFAAGYVIVANTSGSWEAKDLELGLLSDVNSTAVSGQVLFANTTGGFEFGTPSNVIALDLNDLGDVDTTGVANGEALTYLASSGQFEFVLQGWKISGTANATTGDTISTGENVNFFGANNISVNVTTGASGETNIEIAQDAVVLGINGLTDAVTYDNGVSIGVGAGALENDDDTVNYNTAFGYQSLGLVSTGSGNVGVGANAGDNITSGFNNIVIGRSAQATSDTASNEITLGNANIATFRVPGIALTANSTAISLGAATVATQSYVTTSVSNAIDALIDSSPGTLDTLNELAAALGDDPNFATTVTNSLATKATLDTDVSFANVSVEHLSSTQIITGQVSSIANHDTDDLTEGTRLYYTQARANTAIDARVTKIFVDNLNIDADTLDGQNGTYYLDWTNVTNKPDPILTINGDAAGTATFTDLGSATLTLTIADDSHNHIIGNVDGLQTALDAKADDTTTITAGAGLTGGGSIGANRTISHADTSSQASVNNSLGNVIQDITLDEYGHITAIASTDLDTRFLGITAKASDADLLDGENGTYYLDYNNFANTPTLYTTSNANTDIDARVTKTFVDNLNVDADTLDGQNGSYYLDYNNFTNAPGATTVSATAPTSPSEGDLWWDEDVGNLFIYYVDADTSAWVEASPNPNPFTYDENTDTYSLSGNLTVSGDIGSNSDIALKDNINTFENGLDAINAMRGVRYDWKESGKSSIGLIAQEVEEILPELVNEQDGIKSVQYANIVAVLIEAVKELSAKVEELEKK